MTYPLESVLGVARIIRKTFLSKAQDPGELIVQFVDYATRVRREGILSWRRTSRAYPTSSCARGSS